MRHLIRTIQKSFSSSLSTVSSLIRPMKIDFSISEEEISADLGWGVDPVEDSSGKPLSFKEPSAPEQGIGRILEKKRSLAEL